MKGWSARPRDSHSGFPWGSPQPPLMQGLGGLWEDRGYTREAEIQAGMTFDINTRTKRSIGEAGRSLNSRKEGVGPPITSHRVNSSAVGVLIHPTNIV